MAIALAAFLASTAPATAASASATGGSTPSKTGSTWRHRTPRALLREFSTDRPDKTESAYTVGAGYFQIEMDLLSYTHDRDRLSGGDTRTEAWAVAPVNLKAGLLEDLDLQLVLETFNRVHTEDRVAGSTVTRSGFGDVTVRLKKNLWGNDSGKTAFAVMPFIKLPSNQDELGNDAVEGGVIFPLGVELAAGWGLGAMTEVDLLRDDAGTGYHASFINSITIGRDFAGRVGGYVELFSEVSTERGRPWAGSVDFGFTYVVTEDVRFDAGVNIGVTRAADDFNPFLGLSWRF